MESPKINNEKNLIVSFPIPFPTECLMVEATKKRLNDGDNIVEVVSFNKNSVTLHNNNPESTVFGVEKALIFAIGF